MAKKTIAELLTESKQLKEAIKKQKEELRNRKMALATEYTSNMTEQQVNAEIKECQSLLENAKAKATEIKATYKESMKALKEDIAFAKERMAFVNYKATSPLPKRKNSFRIEKNVLTFSREGLTEISIDISKVNWQKVFKSELAKQGINGDDRVADNIIYKAKCLIDSNIKI